MGRMGICESATSNLPGGQGPFSELSGRNPGSSILGTSRAGVQPFDVPRDPMWSDASASTRHSISFPPELGLFVRVRRRSDADRSEDACDDGGDSDISDPPSTDNDSGMRNENRLPSPTFESTRSWPPNCSTIRATTASPRPGNGPIHLRIHGVETTATHRHPQPRSSWAPRTRPARTRGICSPASRCRCRTPSPPQRSPPRSAEARGGPRARRTCCSAP